jgi:tRNA (guanine-N7-)-methyltransferase
MSQRRSIYVEKLKEFTDVALIDESAFSHRGRWRNVFHSRIGPSFNGQIIFEIGCADAEYVCRVAAKRAETAFVAIDWKYGDVCRGARRVAEIALRNVLLLRGRAQDVHQIFTGGEIDEAWLFHPEPCDRPREIKNRLVSPAFLAELHGVLRSSGVLAIKTDHRAYYDWVLEVANVPVVAQQFTLSAISDHFWNDPQVLSHVAQRAFAGELTAWERRFANHRPIYFVELTRR